MIHVIVVFCCASLPPVDRPRIYSAGTWGPAESIALIVEDKRYWYEHIVESQPRVR